MIINDKFTTDQNIKQLTAQTITAYLYQVSTANLDIHYLVLIPYPCLL